MKGLLLAIAFCAASLNAADLSGKWTGKAQYEENGEQQEPAVVLQLKQDGSTVTGTVESNGESFPIRDGKVDGNHFTFTLVHDSGPINFAVDVNGSEMTGEGTHENEGIKIKLSAKRETASTSAAAGSVTGKWTGTADWDSGSTELTLDLKQDGPAVTGTSSTDQSTFRVEHGRYENGKFTFDSNPEDGPVKVELTVAGNQMTGTAVKMYNGTDRYDVKLSLKRAQ